MEDISRCSGAWGDGTVLPLADSQCGVLRAKEGVTENCQASGSSRHPRVRLSGSTPVDMLKCESESVGRSVMSDSLRPRGL